MSDTTSRYEDLERTDVLPQLTLDSNSDAAATHMLGKDAVENTSALPMVTNGSASRIHTLPAKPQPVALELGGIRGKLADLESKLHETQDDKVDLTRQCQQLEMRSRAAEQRAIKAEAEGVLQSSELSRVSQRALDAEQRLNEQRVRMDAHLADLERRLVDARARGDKRSVRLELELGQESERVAQSDREATILRLELEKLRAELDTTRASLVSLQERAAKQTKAAADISRLYAQQSKQAEVFAASMGKSEQHIARVQAAKLESDRVGAELQLKLRAANDDILKLQADLERQRRHAADIQTQIEARDVQVAQLMESSKAQEISIHELQLTERRLQADAVQMQENMHKANAEIEQRQAQTQRLELEIHQQEERIHRLEKAREQAHVEIAERDRLLTSEKGRALSTDLRYNEASEQIRILSEQSHERQNRIELLQAELQMRSSEFAESIAAIETLKRDQAAFLAAAETQQAELAAYQVTLRQIETERDHIEAEHRNVNGELGQVNARYDEAVQAIIAAREAISVREQRNATLEAELHATIARLHESTARADIAASTAQNMSHELRERETRIAMLEQKLSEHSDAISTIGQDIERVSSAHPSDTFAALGYALETFDGSGVSHRITRATTTVGRSNSNDISIDSSSVSRYHARLLVKPEGVWLVDLQSTNGCGVNGRRASRQILCDGDTVIIGHCRFRFVMSATESRSLDQRDVSSSVALAQVTTAAAGSQLRH